MENLKINYLIAADQAIVDDKGKVSAIGIFDKIQATDAPALHSKFSLILNISGERDKEYKDCKVEIWDEKNSKELATAIIPAISFIGSSNINLILDFVNILFPYFGKYPLKITIGENEMTTENHYVIFEKI